MSENLKPLITELEKQGVYPFLCHNCKKPLISDGMEVVQCPSCGALNQVPEQTLQNMNANQNAGCQNCNDNNNNCNNCNNCNTINIEGDDYYNQTVAICPFCGFSNKIDIDTNKVICFQCNNVFNVNGYQDYLYNNIPNYPIQPITVRTIRKIPVQNITYDYYNDCNSCNGSFKDNYLINEIIDKLEVKKNPPVRYYQLSDINLIRDLNELEERRYMRYKILNEERHYPKYSNNRFRKFKYKKKIFEKKKNNIPVTINVTLKDNDKININGEDDKNNNNYDINKYYYNKKTFDKISNSNYNKYNNNDNDNFKSYSFNTINSNDNNNRNQEKNAYDKANINLNIIRERKNFSEYANPIINNSYSFKDKNDRSKCHLCWKNDSFLHSLNYEIRNDPNFKYTLSSNSDCNFNKTDNFRLKKQFSSRHLFDNLHNSMNITEEQKTNRSYSVLKNPEKKENNSTINYKLFGGLEFK